jgi:hypothetical protein
MKKNAGKILDKAAVTASASDNRVRPLLRYDLNIVNAIENIVKNMTYQTSSWVSTLPKA